MDELEARVTKLEVLMGERMADIGEIKDNVEEIRKMLNGYLDSRIEQKFLQMAGKTTIKIVFAVLTSSVFISLILGAFWR